MSLFDLILRQNLGTRFYGLFGGKLGRGQSYAVQLEQNRNDTRDRGAGEVLPPSHPEKQAVDGQKATKVIGLKLPKNTLNLFTLMPASATNFRRSSLSRNLVPDFLDVLEIAEVAFHKVDIRLAGGDPPDLDYGSVTVFDFTGQQKSAGAWLGESAKNFVPTSSTVPPGTSMVYETTLVRIENGSARNVPFRA